MDQYPPTVLVYRQKRHCDDVGFLTRPVDVYVETVKFLGKKNDLVTSYGKLGLSKTTLAAGGFD